MGTREHQRRRSWHGIQPRDLLLPLLFGVVATIEMVAQGIHPLPVSIGTYWLGVLVVCARRGFPLAVPLLIAAIYVLTPLLGSDLSDSASWLLTPALAFFAAGLHQARTAAGFASVAGAMAIMFATLEGLTSFNPDILFGLVWGFGPWAVGVSLNKALEHNRELAAEIERARIESEMAAAAAAAAERDRIARELHDVLAHSLSVMVVQAMLAEDLLERDPTAAIDAMHEVQQTGRDALGETGRLLRLIRDERDELGMQPQHGIADLPALADDYARAGMKIDLAIDPAAHTLPGGIGLSTYRIVQEGLTNALKHAPGSAVTVKVARDDGEVKIEVRNGTGTATPMTDVQSGHGLIGVRERVALFGGTLHAAATEGGGFVLAATIPVGADPR